MIRGSSTAAFITSFTLVSVATELVVSVSFDNDVSVEAVDVHAAMTYSSRIHKYDFISITG